MDQKQETSESNLTHSDRGWEQSSGKPIHTPEAISKTTAGVGAVVGKVCLGALKSVWWCVKLLGRFTWYMANIFFVVSQRRRIMDSDKSDVVKMQEMNNFRDSVHKTGFIDKDDMMWSKNEGSRRHFK